MVEPNSRNSPRSAALTGRQRWFQSQWLEIDRALRDGATLAQRRDQPLLDQWVLAGRQRELRAARSVVAWLAGGIPDGRPEPIEQAAAIPPENPQIQTQSSPPPIPPDDDNRAAPQSIDLTLWRSTLFDQAVERLTVDRLVNLTGAPLELDILHPDRRRELLALVLRRIERGLDEIRRERLRGEPLAARREALLQGWWMQLLEDFLADWLGGAAARSPAGSSARSPVVQRDRLLADWPIIMEDILHRAVAIEALIDHLLWGVPLVVDGVTAEAGTAAALDRASALLHNLTLCLACAVVQPILNRYSDAEPLKLALFDRRWLPTREVERFRNDLAWKYRVQRWVNDPKAIYESRYWLLTASDRGIITLPIYAPRNQEWRDLSGVPLGLTLLIEARDAIAPRVRSTVTLAGRGALMVLQAIGRGIGFIGRGIIQGLGDALDRRKNS